MDRTLLTAALAIGAGVMTSCYKTDVNSCELKCAVSDNSCPDGLTCNGEGLCATTSTTSCSAIDAPSTGSDARTIDAPPDAEMIDAPPLCSSAPFGANTNSYVCGSATPPTSSSACLVACPNKTADGSDSVNYTSNGWTGAILIGSDAQRAARQLATGSAGPLWIGLHGSDDGAFVWVNGSALDENHADWSGSGSGMGSNVPAVDATICVSVNPNGWNAQPCAGGSGSQGDFRVLLSSP